MFSSDALLAAVTVLLLALSSGMVKALRDLTEVKVMLTMHLNDKNAHGGKP